jgi:hypothetical protein
MSVGRNTSAGAVDACLPEALAELPLNLQKVLKELPPRVTRKRGASLVRQHFFETSERTLERWPLAFRTINGRAHAETAELFVVAHRKLMAAPRIMAGCHQK